MIENRLDEITNQIHMNEYYETLISKDERNIKCEQLKQNILDENINIYLLSQIL
jgi:hypothetical protein